MSTQVKDVVQPVVVLAGWAIRESLRRRVFVIVALLTVAFIVLYAIGGGLSAPALIALVTGLLIALCVLERISLLGLLQWRPAGE